MLVLGFNNTQFFLKPRESSLRLMANIFSSGTDFYICDVSFWKKQ